MIESTSNNHHDKSVGSSSASNQDNKYKLKLAEYMLKLWLEIMAFIQKNIEIDTKHLNYHNIKPLTPAHKHVDPPPSHTKTAACAPK